jgi:Protein of unknown function (DUF1566)
MNENKTSRLSAIFGILLSVLALQAQSDCGSFEGFVDNKDGTVTDPRFGTIWKRCAEGAEFDGKTCSGKASSTNWYEAAVAAKASRFLGKDDWRIPTLIEFYGITGYKLGLFEDCKMGYYNEPNDIAVSKMLSAGSYWSTSRSKNQENGNLIKGINFDVIDFVTGDFSPVAAGYDLPYRLVRAGVPSTTPDGKLEKQFEFDHEYEITILPALKKMQATDKALQKILVSKDPEAMYSYTLRETQGRVR